MPVSDDDVTNLIQNTNILKVADSAAPDGSGHRGFLLALKPGSGGNLNSLLAPFQSDASYEVWGPVTDAQNGDAFILKCPTPKCPIISGVAKDICALFRFF
jgi:hypothetical protein